MGLHQTLPKGFIGNLAPESLPERSWLRKTKSGSRPAPVERICIHGEERYGHLPMGSGLLVAAHHVILAAHAPGLSRSRPNSKDQCGLLWSFQFSRYFRLASLVFVGVLSARPRGWCESGAPIWKIARFSWSMGRHSREFPECGNISDGGFPFGWVTSRKTHTNSQKVAGLSQRSSPRGANSELVLVFKPNRL